VRILFFSSVYPNPYHPARGPFNRELVSALRGEHCVSVVSPIPWVEELRARRHQGNLLDETRSVIQDGVELHCPRFYYTPKVLRRFYGRFLWASSRPCLQRVMADFRPDVILSYWLHPDGQAAAEAATMAGIPNAVIVGGSDILLLPRDAARRRCVLQVLDRADALLAVSRHLRRKMIELGAPAEKVHVFDQGVNGTYFYPGSRAEARRRLGIPQDRRMLLWVGRMAPVKGLDVLLQACAQLKGEGFDHHLYLVGDGPLMPEIRQAVTTKRLSSFVTFAGPAAPARLGEWYRAADYTVLPSRSEGLPNVLRESLACLTPFIASDVGGISELATDGVSRLVPPEDPACLATTVGEALARPVRLRSTDFRSPTWDDSARSVADILMRIAGRTTVPVPVR
jgi:glycosyltransferase involved in cell wall biosynthesis